MSYNNATLTCLPTVEVGCSVKLLDLIQRTQPPMPWQEGDNIPWHEPGFSGRMLAEHLSQTHDRASRRSHLIDQHVAWIHQVLLQERATRILDLGCGPGLYSNRLAALGHHCIGIDYSPASIAYAKAGGLQAKIAATYHLEDIRTASYGSGFGFAMLIYGELNVFSHHDATTILTKLFRALSPGGLLLLEAHTFESLHSGAQAPLTWFSSSGGLFSPLPHLCLMEQHWQAEGATLTRRYFIIDAESAEVTRYAQTMQAYTALQYQQLLAGTGFTQVEFLPGLAHDRISPAPDFCAILARRPA
jgi:SAM-dependent methyltransferase